MKVIYDFINFMVFSRCFALVIIVVMIAFEMKAERKLLTCDEFLNEPIINEEHIQNKKCTFSYVEFKAFDEVNISAAVVKEFDFDNEMNEVDVSSAIESVEFVSSRFPQLPPKLFVAFANLKAVSCDGVNLNSLSKADFKAAVNLESFSCNSNYVKSLENSLFSGSKKLQSLDLSINQIEDIERFAFSGLEKLKKLLLYDNKLQKLSANVFKDLISLEEINLSSNQITVIEEQLFKSCKLLNYIYLNDNRIQNFSEKSLVGIKEIRFLELSNNELSELDLSISASALYANNNQLTSVKLKSVGYLSFFNNSIDNVNFEHEEGVLSLNISTNNLNAESLKSIIKLSGVKSLDLSFNILGTLNVSTFLNMSQLQILNLQSTNLTEIGFGLFTHQTDLEQLDLSYNKLNALDLTKLASVKALTTLFIEGNNISKIDFEKIKTILPALKLFGFSDNAWSCAYLTTVVSYLKQNDIEVYHLITDKTKPNVDGIVCSESVKANEQVNYEDKSLSVNPIKHHELRDRNELRAISEKFEVILRHVNETKENFATKNELINELNMIKSVVASLKQEIQEMRKQNNKLTISDVRRVVNETLASERKSSDYDQEVNGLDTKVNSIEQSINEMKRQLKPLSKPTNEIDGKKTQFSSVQNAPTTANDDLTTKLMITVIFVIVCGFAIIYVMKLVHNKRITRKFITRRARSETESMNENIL